MVSRRTAVVLAILSLVAGGVVYAISRSGLEVHVWLRVLDFESPRLELPAFVRYNLPDALWQFSFAVAILVVWRDAHRCARTWVFLALPLLIGLGIELGQAAHVIEGVFDPVDLAVMLLAAAAAVVTVGLPAGQRACS